MAVSAVLFEPHTTTVLQVRVSGGPLHKLPTGTAMQSLCFRVWDDEYSIMIWPSDVWISFVFLEGSAEPDAYLFDRKKKQWKPIPIHDVMRLLPHPEDDGREVFEGDIVKLSSGREVIVDTIDRYSRYCMIDSAAVSQPEILSLPGSRVLVVGNNGKSPGRGLERLVRERWQAERN